MIKNTRSLGFTLLEISIVLTIIALVVGGVLLGSHLILSSRIQRTVSQVDKLAAATYAFKSKYNWLPGDMIPSAAQTAGLVGSPCYVSGLSGTMTGQSVPEGLPFLPDGCSPDYWVTTTGNDKIDEGTRENVDFYTHLSLAQLIDSYYGFTLWGATLDEARVWPEPGVKRGIIYPAYCTDSDCFLLGISFILDIDGTAVPTLDLFTTTESYGIDAKFDDGKPTSGRVKVLDAYDAIGRNGGGGIVFQTSIPLSQGCCTVSAHCTDVNDAYRLAEDSKYQCTLGVKW